jgi:cytochrome c peroxidase
MGAEFRTLWVEKKKWRLRRGATEIHFMETKSVLTKLLLIATFMGTVWAQAAEPLSPSEVLELRKHALQFTGVIPDKMPGADKDTPAQMALGKKLYFDPILSQNQSQSCNTCHRVDGGLPGSDGEATSPGAFGKRGDRNSPTTLNAGFHHAQFWDGRAADLKEQAKGPVLNPVEMAMPDETEVLKRLRTHVEYPGLFKTAFPGASETVTYDNMAEAIAAFERTLITRDRFDDFLKGKDTALSAAELGGLKTFLANGCTACHNGPLLGANSYQKAGLVHPFPTKDPGRRTVTQEESDEAKFKVPTLRNIALTGPYFHDGSIRSLDDAVKMMGWHQLGKELSAGEIRDIAVFLHTLSGKDRRPITTASKTTR